MIQEFQVQNFYSIREKQTLSFVPNSDDCHRNEYVHKVSDDVELLKLGVIYGSNASGKTNMLRALTFFDRIMVMKPESKSEPMGYLPFLLDKHSENEHSFMQMTLWVAGEKYIMSIEFDMTRIYFEHLQVYESKRPATVYTRIYNEETDHSEVTFGAKSGINKDAQRAISGNTTNNCSVMAAFGESNAATSKLNLVYEFFFSGIQSLLEPRDTLSYDVKSELRTDKDGKKKKFLLDLLKASDFNITDINLDGHEETITPEMEKIINSAPISEEARREMLSRGTIKHDEILFSHIGDNGKYELNEYLESAGTKRFLGMSMVLYYILHNRNFVPIDEIETSIHYELLSYFIKLFLANSEGSSQILMTTHDINLLNEEFIRRDVVWFTDKDNVGATSLKRLSSMGLHKTMSPYNAYKQGKLVKLPFLGSIYLDTGDHEHT